MHLWFNYLPAARIQLQMQDLFGQYVPPELVQKMAQNPSHYSMEGRAAELTVLFSDIRGFTRISEKLPAKELALLINEYLTEMSMVIRANGGTLDKYIGDAIMTFWGAPVADAQHAQHALDSARAMMQALPALNQRFEAKGWPRLQFGVGINTGPMTVGDMGSKVRRSYTVMGDSVNLASRLESLTKHYGVALLIGQATQIALPNTPLLEVDRVRVKGKDEAVTIYTDFLAPITFAPHSADHQRWNQALHEFRTRQWDVSTENFQYFVRMFDGLTLAQLYLDRIAQQRMAALPDDWDGVMSFDH
jgi:adenylate cyclase